ncbi:putative serine esterase Mb1866c [Aspergillus lentulus]|uniref:Serine esterase Mb1866c n=1 Tax=Aspergillus lentulus TaxID=293939 RepID=A0ABQ1AKX4_ASPLE|nr:putative serine esterase Mb1866c [Aspergillus lentulus]GFG11965.1 putative serine esterase Mb1866c [Aspergillus lentulus]
MASPTFSEQIIYQPAKAPEEPGTAYAGFKPSSIVLPKGHQRTSECRALPIDLIWDRDVMLPMRDGVRIAADIFRPADATTPLPALMAWSPYGKTGAGVISLDLIPHRAGVPKSQLSGYEKWEAPDPAEWCRRGYAVVNVDARGVFDSEGDIRWLGTGEGQDGFDAVEAIASLPWCNGRVALVGNSWLAMAQWFIAAERPPHLYCIAPLEGATDFYRETLCRGGVPFTPFWAMLRSCLSGRNRVEDPVAMVERYPTWNSYWADKRARLEKITIPAYILASYSTMIHTEGSFRGFTDLASSQKWLTVHATQEWYDLYSQERIEDLALFLGHYLKDEENSWERTPRVRAAILPFNKPALTNVPYSAWPPTETVYETLYLLAGGNLSAHPDDRPGSSVVYPADIAGMQSGNDPGELEFVYTFTAPKTLLGHSKAVLYMSAPDHNDLDVFVQLRKADTHGTILEHLNIPLDALQLASIDNVEQINPLKYLGPTGILRASHRQLDCSLSKAFYPVYAHDKEDKIPRGQVVRLEIALWPAGIAFEPGESLILRIGGHPQVLPEFSTLGGKWTTLNRGSHVVYCGREYQSHLCLPFLDNQAP